MTLQGFVIKSDGQAFGAVAALRGALRNLMYTAIAIHRRRKAVESLQLWMLHERTLQDCGYSEFDAEISRLADAKSIPLGHFGFASMLFQNRRTGDPRGIDDAMRFRG